MWKTSRRTSRIRKINFEYLTKRHCCTNSTWMSGLWRFKLGQSAVGTVSELWRDTKQLYSFMHFWLLGKSCNGSKNPKIKECSVSKMIFWRGQRGVFRQNELFHVIQHEKKNAWETSASPRKSRKNEKVGNIKHPIQSTFPSGTANSPTLPLPSRSTSIARYHWP